MNGNEPLPIPNPDEWAAAKRDPSSRSLAAGVEAPISAELLQAVIDAARRGVPNEACGLLVADHYWAEGGAPARWIELRNAAQSPYRYMIDAQDQLHVWTELDDAGEIVWAIVHSHVTSPAEPSQTDVGLAYYPDSLYVICSLAEPDRPTVRAWAIADGAVSEVALLVSG